jgi:hypothetical protein
MKKIWVCIILSFLLAGCNSVKRNQKFISQGDYDKAIEIAVRKIQKNRSTDKVDSHILLLEQAFKKAVNEDKQRIAFLEKDNKVFHTRELYYLYFGLDEGQSLIRPLLPLYINSEGRNAKLPFKDYSDEIIDARDRYLTFLYDEGTRLMNQDNTMDYRKAYSIYCEITDIHPNYRDSKQLMDDSHFLGTDFVMVSLQNDTFQIIPYHLERDLLDFNTYGLDDFWTEFHDEFQNGIQYNYEVLLNFRKIDFSPEQITEREFHREKKIKTGWNYKRDRNGNIINDENGDPIKIDTYETVSADIVITSQTKSVFVGGDVIYRDLQRNRDMNRHPLASEFIFENVFATYYGDERALTNEDRILIANRFAPFPNNAQMLLDAADDVKLQLKQILKDHSIRP